MMFAEDRNSPMGNMILAHEDELSERSEREKLVYLDFVRTFPDTKNFSQYKSSVGDPNCMPADTPIPS
jgi:hypothetical protein